MCLLDMHCRQLAKRRHTEWSKFLWGRAHTSLSSWQRLSSSTSPTGSSGKRCCSQLPLFPSTFQHYTTRTSPGPALPKTRNTCPWDNLCTRKRQARPISRNTCPRGSLGTWSWRPPRFQTSTCLEGTSNMIPQRSPQCRQSMFPAGTCRSLLPLRRRLSRKTYRQGTPDRRLTKSLPRRGKTCLEDTSRNSLTRRALQQRRTCLEDTFRTSHCSQPPKFLTTCPQDNSRMLRLRSLPALLNMSPTDKQHSQWTVTMQARLKIFRAGSSSMFQRSQRRRIPSTFPTGKTGTMTVQQRPYGSNTCQGHNFHTKKCRLCLL